MEIDVKQTQETINEIADQLEYYAADLRWISEKMGIKNDISYAAEAMNTIRNCFGNLRIDLLVTRPIRELTREKR